MSDQSLHDTAVDFSSINSRSPPWRTTEAATWAGAVGVASAGTWFVIVFGWRLLFGPLFAFSAFSDGAMITAAICAAISGVYGLLVGGIGGFLCGRPTRIRTGFACGVGLASLSALGGGLLPLAAIYSKPLPPEVSTATVWMVVGAAVGLAGYTHQRMPARTPPYGPIQQPAWHVTSAVGWAATIGGLAAVAWYGELTLIRLLPSRVELGPIVHGNELQLTVGMALLGGAIGLVVGGTFGFILGSPSRLNTGLIRGLYFASVGAAGGGLFPLAVSATAGYLSAEVSSSVTWGLVSGLAAVIAYTWTRWPESEPMYSDDRRVSDRETVVVRYGIRLGVGSNESGEPMSMSRGVTTPVDEELDPVVTSGWDPVASVQTEAPPARPKVIPAQRTSTFGPVARVTPVVMVTIVCLLAVGLSTPSPAGWPMLGVALLGLAASWALIGQERRIRELERRVGGPGS